MGRVRTKHVRNIAKQILSKYYDLFTTDIELNKRILDVIADFPSKRLRNIVAGYITSLIRKIKESS